jgi:hypothetical protein
MLEAIMRTRTFLASIIAISAACAMSAAPAQAETTGACAGPALSQPFLPWADPSWYRLAPGGAFESRRSSWTLSGGAGLASGNESFMVRSDQDDQSLSLGAAGSATTPSICLAVTDPTIRFFVRNTGSPLSLLQVSIRFADSAGDSKTIPLTVVAADADWQPSLPIPVLLNLLNVPILSDGSSDVRFEFTPIGAGGDWTIDDVYVDPFKTR